MTDTRPPQDHSPQDDDAEFAAFLAGQHPLNTPLKKVLANDDHVPHALDEAVLAAALPRRHEVAPSALAAPMPQTESSPRPIMSRRWQAVASVAMVALLLVWIRPEIPGLKPTSMPVSEERDGAVVLRDSVGAPAPAAFERLAKESAKQEMAMPMTEADEAVGETSGLLEKKNQAIEMKATAKKLLAPAAAEVPRAAPPAVFQCAGTAACATFSGPVCARFKAPSCPPGAACDERAPQTFASACEACANPDVVWMHAGTCEP